MPAIALAALKNWSAAEELFDICASSPGSAASAIQMEALKKLAFIQSIYHGKHDYLCTIVQNEQQLFTNIECSEISAELSADGTVSFSDPPVKFKKTDVDRVLAQVQQQDSLLVRLEKGTKNI
ncbi:hypothetical protein EV702DRAFT_1050403 [Suillus placidus]|uniref:COP9 signalosome complex subunit 3 N-terminal helical repeats domain-containing protein n=1 Tax=Suillus placidus TaxID=48579 RepID=A0A9P6ZIM8_9AGAM|nr:hypothetical protein EV702DRAFT_1050403 [Suillus placidus]